MENNMVEYLKKHLPQSPEVAEYVEQLEKNIVILSESLKVAKCMASDAVPMLGDLVDNILDFVNNKKGV